MNWLIALVVAAACLPGVLIALGMLKGIWRYSNRK